MVEDYHILQTTRDEYLIREIRNGMEAAGVPVEFSKGEAGKGQHEINLVYAEALEMADRNTIYKNGAKEIADSTAGRSRSWPSTTWTTSARRATSTPACGTRKGARRR